MILGAGLLLLVGLGLLVAGVLTGITALYWACVGVCLVAAVLLFLVRRELVAEPAPAPEREPARTPEPRGEAMPATKEQATARRSTAEPEIEPEPEPEPEPEMVRPREPEPERVWVREPEPAQMPAAVGEAPLEEVEVTDLLLVVDLHDEVLVIDEHPRYHLGGCVHLTGRTTIPLPIDEARADGFTPCGSCRPDRNLADRVRAGRHARES